MDGSVPEALRRIGDSLDIESGGTRARAAVLTTVSTAWADRVHPHVFYFHISNVPALTASNPNQSDCSLCARDYAWPIATRIEGGSRAECVGNTRGTLRKSR